MKLSNYIKDLKDALEEHGDLDVVYSIDDEGNSFDKVYLLPSVGYYHKNDKDFTLRDDYLQENDIYDEIDDEIDDDLELVICIN